MEPATQRKQRIDSLYSGLLKHKEIPVSKIKDTIRKEWGLSERVINEYIAVLATRDRIKVNDGKFMVER